jgi:hypothetical protein
MNNPVCQKTVNFYYINERARVCNYVKKKKGIFGLSIPLVRELCDHVHVIFVYNTAACVYV